MASRAFSPSAVAHFDFDLFSLIDYESRAECIFFSSMISVVASCIGVSMGFDKSNTFDYLRDLNGFTDLEAFGLLFGQQICAIVAFTVLEIREDRILPVEENKMRGFGTDWPRDRVHWTLYFSIPFFWTCGWAAFMWFRHPALIFSDYSGDSWLVWAVKMVLWVLVWEFLMYNAHRLFHSIPWLYNIAHKGHHVVMDFPLGPHAPFLEKLSNYSATIIAAKVVGVSAGSWIFANNVLMAQCVLEHAYSSFELPIFHSICVFNTADLHQDHHVRLHGNYGYAFNIYDPLFGTQLETKKERIEVSGPATGARMRMLLRNNNTSMN